MNETNAPAPAPRMVGLGEVLWDRFPDLDRLGGAPANFAFHAGQLGAEARVVSRVGLDADGARAEALLRDAGLSLEDWQRDPAHPTGTVLVHLDRGQPSYHFATPAAWDFLEWTPGLEALAARTEAVAFGTLAQRHEVSRATIRRFLGHLPRGALRLFDINLRQDFYSAETIEFGLTQATVLKLNEAELPQVGRLFGWPNTAAAFAGRLAGKFGVRYVALTLGEAGCEIYGPDGMVRSAAPRIACRDAVGAGDAFAAALVTGLWRGHPLQLVADWANRIGAYVASQPGAMPRLPRDLARP